MRVAIADPPTDSVARIGANSVLQLVPLLDEHLGRAERDRILQESGMPHPPIDDGLMAEQPAANLHQRLRADHPGLAAQLTESAGDRTGAFIIQNRMPPAALLVLRRLPPWLAGPLLVRVIEKHSWTFAGSGEFRVIQVEPAIFEIIDNPVVRGESANEPICHWHTAVFAHLFRDIVDPNLQCREVSCCAMGDDACRFEIY